MTRYPKYITIYLLLLFLLAFLGDRSDAQAPQPELTFHDCSECPEMVVIPAGKFLMGSSAADTERDFAAIPTYDLESHVLSWFWPTEIGNARRSLPKEHPQHRVTIAHNFGMGKYLVTVEEYAAFVRETGYSTGPCLIWSRPRTTHSPGHAWSNPGFAPTARDPVVCVNWYDAKAYIEWLNRKVRGASSNASDGPYRLPSEAEWEYAARAGTETARWWGDAIGTANAKCDGCGDPDDRRQPASVGTFPANPFDLYDVLGNAWQWTEDCGHENYADAPSDGRAWAHADCALITVRGGSWNSTSWVLRSATRSGIDPDKATSDLGFRVAKTLR
ncbi:MAG: formylglycine-generating enzyme family protein [Rhodopila sp.]|nr:formylglycine-generating enzyme family protein [Rhodopila sp.]